MCLGLISNILWELGTACNYNDMYLPGLSIIFHILIFEGDGPICIRHRTKGVY